MNYYMLRDGKRRVNQVQVSAEQSKKANATKLFTHLLCHGEECRLDVIAAKKRLDKFTGRNVAQGEALAFIKSFPKKFEVKIVDGREFVEAKTSVKLCDAFQAGKCDIPSCEQLHICRFFLQGSCKFGEKCNKPHSFNSPETTELLRRHHLGNLPPDALRSLFKKVLNEKIVQHTSQSLGPKTCDFYNKGVCKNGDKCKFLHVCEHFIEGDCKFFGKCKRFHNFDSPHSRKVLQAHSLGGLRNENQILSVLRSALEVVDLSSDSEDDDVVMSVPFFPVSSGRSSRLHSSSSTSETDQEKLEICGFNLRGKCQYGTQCNARHTSLPYEWQYLFGSPEEWKSFSLEENRKIEKEFCNVQQSHKRVVSLNERFICSINFQTLMGKIQDTGTEVEIRRLSTVSSVFAASGHVFRTKWKWYWLDEHNNWQSYDDEKTTTNSEKIELDYKSDSGKNIKHKFSCGPYQYTLHFDNPNQLYQENDRLGTNREVRRRPAQFLNEEDMEAILEEFKRNRQRTSSSSSNVSESQYSVPRHWTPVDASEEFKVVDLSEVLHHEEFTKVERLFLATMAGYKIKSVKRVQNAGLWEDYERQKSKIKKKNSGTAPEERWLFHGTNQDTVDPICQQGFDWRLSGKHGTRYGKGSYFAVKASYSNNYSNNYSAGDNRKMFMARAIVGSYVLGDYNTQRPPSKDKSNPLSVLHDSCVDNVSKPSIFVVFERSQVYPYYIIDYGT